MPIGNVTVNIKDGGLGIVPSTGVNTFCVLGTSQLGTVGNLYSYSSVDDILTNLGYGPMPELMAYILSVAGGSVLGMKLAAATTVSTSSTVTATRVASSTGVVSVSSGVGYDDFSVVVKIVSAGTGQALASGLGLSISLDGGTTFLPTAITATSPYTIPNTGLAIGLTASTYDFGDQFTFTTNMPLCTSAELSAGFTSLFALPNTWGMAVLANTTSAFGAAPPSGATAATTMATLATSLDTNLTSAASNFRYARGMIGNASSSSDANLTAAFVTSPFVSSRVMVAAGTETLTSVLRGNLPTRPIGWGTVARLAAQRVSTSPGRIADGPIVGAKVLNRDERKTPGLFDQGFHTATTIIGVAGNFVDIGRVMASAGSDFTYIMNGRVMDQACSISRAALLTFLNSSVRVNAGTGTILEQDARGIEKYVESAIRSQMAADISPDSASSPSVQITVNRTDNILSTSNLRVKVRIVPLGYVQSITEDIGFLNPSLVLS